MTPFWQQVLTSGAFGSIVAALLVYLNSRQSKKQDINAEIRKELWQEVQSLRVLLTTVNTSVVEWQSKYITLLEIQAKNSQEISLCKVALEEAKADNERLKELMSEALAVCGRVEEAQAVLATSELDVKALKEVLEGMRRETASLKRRHAQIDAV